MEDNKNELTENILDTLGEIPNNLIEGEESEKATQESLNDFISELGINLSHEDIKQTALDNSNMEETVQYALGLEGRPDYLEKFLADIEPRLKDLSLSSCALQLAEIPKLMKVKKMVDDTIYTQENLDNMSMTTRINLSNSLRKEISDVSTNTFKVLQSIGSIGAVDSTYRKVLDALMTMSPEMIKRVAEVIKREQEY